MLPIFHMMFVTGQMPFTSTSATSAYPEGIEAQTRQVMENLKRVGVTALAREALVEIDFIARRG